MSKKHDNAVKALSKIKADLATAGEALASANVAKGYLAAAIQGFNGDRSAALTSLALTTAQAVRQLVCGDYEPARLGLVEAAKGTSARAGIARAGLSAALTSTGFVTVSGETLLDSRTGAAKRGTKEQAEGARIVAIQSFITAANEAAAKAEEAAKAAKAKADTEEAAKAEEAPAEQAAHVIGAADVSISALATMTLDQVAAALMKAPASMALMRDALALASARTALQDIGAALVKEKIREEEAAKAKAEEEKAAAKAATRAALDVALLAAPAKAKPARSTKAKAKETASV